MNNTVKILAGAGLAALAFTGVGVFVAPAIAAAIGGTGLLGVTATTGAAVGSLTGSALSSAALAAIGGGAVSVGGAGVAGGTAIIAGSCGALGGLAAGAAGAIVTNGRKA